MDGQSRNRKRRTPNTRSLIMATVPQDEATLLSYFQTGDTPTADQFEEFIRTMFFLYNQMVAAAAAAQAAAEAVGDNGGRIPKCFGRVRYDASSNTISSDGSDGGAWTKTNSGSNRKIRYTFTPNQPPHATRYLLYQNVNVSVVSLTQNIAYIEWEINGFSDCFFEMMAWWPDP